MSQPEFSFENPRDQRRRQVADLLKQRREQNAASFNLDYWRENPRTQDALTLTQAGQSVLDLGCGTGEIALWLAREGRIVTGYDISGESIAMAREYAANETQEVQDCMSFDEGDGTRLPYAEDSVDVVLLSHVLEQEAHATPLLKEMVRVLKSDGRVVVRVSAGISHYHVSHVRFFDGVSLREELEIYFKDVSITPEDDGKRLRAVCANPVNAKLPKIIAMMNIKNEDRWLKEVLDSAARVADGIVIYDDGSTDRTTDICSMHPAVIAYERRVEASLDKTRDKNRLLAMALKHKPDWVLCLDGDEILEKSASQKIYEAIRTCSDTAGALDFHFLYLWNDREHYRTDGIYDPIYHPCLFRCDRQDPETLKFQPTEHGGNLHCERVPKTLKGEWKKTDIEVLHLGYMFAEDRLRKYHWNKSKDPEHAAQGYYEHLLDQPGQTLVEWNERRPAPHKPTSQSNHTDKDVVKQEVKPEYYYGVARQNLVDLVPLEARRVLDVGCGSGATGGALRSQRGIEVHGIEIHPGIAEAARTRLNSVVVCDIENEDLPFAEGYFDCMLFGDVLEHLTNPWLTLKRMLKLLTPHGTLVVSLPNVRNLSVIEKLTKGSWSYEEQGILDKTHLRFFARQDMLKLFEECGLEAKLAETVRDPLYKDWQLPPANSRVDVEAGTALLRGVSGEELEELTAIQFIFTAKLNVGERQKRERLNSVPEASIIIPVFNNLSYTRQCITSLVTTKESVDSEVIVVDNGSTDGTAEYLKQLGDAVRVVSHAENLGFAKGCNSGARIARGNYLVFLNNDTKVLPGWLSEMVNCVKRDPQIGIVGNLQIFPDTEKVQQCGIVCGPNKQVYSLYNNELPATHPAVQKPREFQFIAGSCFLIGSELFKQVGELDEEYVNSCEDVDLCMKVRAAGRKVFYCPTSRIYHYESKTATGHPKDSPNYKRFLSRWADSMVQDDFRYLQEDGFLHAENTQEPISQANSLTEDRSVIRTTQTPPTRAAILTTYHQHCGISGYAESLVRGLREQGVQPLILAEETLDRTQPDDEQVIRCWNRTDRSDRRVLSALQDHKIELLHVNHGGMFAVDGWLTELLVNARKAGIRTMITFHSTESLSPVFEIWCRLADHVFVHHVQNRLELVAHGADADRIEQIPLGMPPVAKSDMVDTKLELGWDPNVAVVSTFGFVEPHKGIVELIEAVSEIAKLRPVRLEIIGRAHPNNPEGPAYVERCRKRAQELGMTEKVTFSDSYLSDDEVSRRLRASDIIVMNYLHRRYENSAATMTALASGRPVITTSVPTFELSAAVTFKVTKDYKLSAAILMMLQNPFLRKTLLGNVFEYEKTARWDVVAKRVADTYSQVASEPPKHEINLMQSYATHPDDIYIEPLQRERIKWLRKRSEGRILEIGPATGYLASYVGAAAAVDINRNRLAVCSSLRSGIRFEYGDVVKGLPYRDKEFDEVMAPEIFEHVDFEDAVRALKECIRVGRRVLVTLPNADKPDYNPDLVHCIEHRWLMTRQNVDRLLREAGAVNYEIDASTEADFYLLDVRADAREPRVSVTRVAAQLTTIDTEPGEPLRLAVDAGALEDPLTAARGIGHYALNQFTEMMKLRPAWSFTIYGSSAYPASEPLQKLVSTPNSRYASWSEFAEEKHDALYFTHPLGRTSCEVMRSLRSSNILTACNFYDLIPLVMAQAYFADNAAARGQYAATLELVKQKCEMFYCASQQTAQDLQIHLQLPQARFRIIHAGVGEAFTREPDRSLSETVLQRHGLTRGEYLMFVGFPDPRKNLWGVLHGTAGARRALSRDLKLVMVGNIPSDQAVAIQRIAKERGLPEGSVNVTGYIPDEELNCLYRSAAALLHPSHYEGFGLATVEAMAASLPVIAANNSAQSEIAGDAALYVNPQSIDEIKDAVVRLMTDDALRRDLLTKGTEQYRRFRWEKVAGKTASYLSETVARRKRQMSGAKRPVKREREAMLA